MPLESLVKSFRNLCNAGPYAKYSGNQVFLFLLFKIVLGHLAS